MSKTLGILGGLGPLAGAHFYRRVLELTPARDDDQHLSVVLLSERSIPSRLEHLAGHGPSPVAALTSVARRIVQAGAEILAIPSTTTHAYYEDIAAAVSIPVLNLLKIVADTVAQEGCRHVGMVATSPTRDYQLYRQAFEAHGLHAVYPDERTQREIMTIIQGVKSTNRLEPWGTRLVQVLEGRWLGQADCVLLACTETPVVFPREARGTRQRDYPIFDATDILAQAAISACCEGA